MTALTALAAQPNLALSPPTCNHEPLPLLYSRPAWVQVCPLLLRVFPRLGAHHQLEDFTRRGDEPKDEVQIYTWMDATLRCVGWGGNGWMGRWVAWASLQGRGANLHLDGRHTWRSPYLLAPANHALGPAFPTPPLHLLCRELCDLVKEVQPAARRPMARLSFAFVYPDRRGKNVMRQVRLGNTFPYVARRRFRLCVAKMWCGR